MYLIVSPNIKILDLIEFLTSNFNSMFIKKFHLVALQNEEHTGFHSYVSDYIAEEGAATLKIEVQANDHKLKLAIEKSVLDLIQKNSHTRQLNMADLARDKPIRGFAKVVKGMLHHFNPAVEEAAYKIDIINESFSGITRLSDEKQSQAFESYTAALAANATEIALLGQTDWVTEMKAKNNVFLDIVKNRNTETDAKPDTNMKLARVETDDAYNTLVDRINAFITIEGEAQFASLVTKINGRIDQYNTALAMRRGHAKKDTKETPAE